MTNAMETVDALLQNASDLADAFRFGSSTLACRRLRGLTETADGLVVTATRISHQIETTLADVAIERPEVAEAISDLASAIDQLDMYQQDADWSAVADTLEQDVTAALTAWNGVFNTLARVAAFRNPGANVA